MSSSLKTYVVLLRGVMPTGKNKVPMAQLRDLLSEAGYLNVRTYIQSGNALVDTHHPAREVEKQVQELIKKHIGPDLTIVVRTGQQLQQVLDENPFKQMPDPSRVFYVLFAEPPPTQKIQEMMAEDYGDEKLVITETSGYMYIPGSAARSRLSNVKIEKKLGVAATTRNLNTMKRLVEMSKAEE